VLIVVLRQSQSGAKRTNANLKRMRCIGRGTAGLAAIVAVTVGLLQTTGCASPGTPRPPSLHLPALVTDLTADRISDSVELRFTAPARSTDGLPLRDEALEMTVCREIGAANPCEPVPELPARIAVARDAMSGKNREAVPVKLTDSLPPSLRLGEPHRVAYRAQIFNTEGRSAGYSQPVYVLAGAAPDSVRGLQASGSRLGIVLRWDADPNSRGEVLLRRQELGPGPAKPQRTSAAQRNDQRALGEPEKPGTGKRGDAARKADEQDDTGVVWLAAGPVNGGTEAAEARTLDDTAARNTPYRYSAVRRLTIKDKDTTLEMRSAESAPVEMTLQAVYPPAEPTALTAVGFAASPLPEAQPNAASHFAVDLIWQPVEDADLAGYNVYRQVIGPHGASVGERQKLNTAPVPQSAFHDASASPGTRYSYSVTAIDTEGNESRAVRTILEPPAQP